MTSLLPLGALTDWVSPFQMIMIVLLIGLIIFYFQYKKKQM